MKNDAGSWVEELMRAGCMPAVAARVVALIYQQAYRDGAQSAPRDAAAEKRRQWDRERKKKQRNRPRPPDFHPTPVDMTGRQWLWTEGVGILIQLGMTDAKARSNIGRWLKRGAADLVLRSALEKAWEAGTGDPVPWVTQALVNGKGAKNGKQRIGYVAEAGRRLIADAEAREGAGGSGEGDDPFGLGS